jgi:hypothetical protein
VKTFLFNANDETGSAGLAEKGDWLASLSGGELGRGADSQVGGPAIGENFPGARGLSNEDDQIFSALFAALAHSDGHEHFATTEIESYIAQHFDAQRFHLHVAQSGFEERDKKFPDRRQAANRGNAGADERGVGGVEFEQIVDVPGVAGLRPVLDNLAGASFGATAGRSARGTGSTPARSGGLRLGGGCAGCRSMTGDLAGDEMMIVVVKVMLGATGSRLNSGIAGDGLVGDSAPHTKASAHRQRTSAS